jgi:hypothetical protein
MAALMEIWEKGAEYYTRGVRYWGGMEEWSRSQKLQLNFEWIKTPDGRA